MGIKKVCVIGMGTMGSQNGIVSARAGHETSMVDMSPEQVERGLNGIRSFLAGRVKKGKIDQEAMDSTLALIDAKTDLIESAKGADLVIEAVYEDIDIKKEVFSALDENCDPDAILASNTSTLWIAEIASATRRPEKCIGTHFLIPAALTPLAELVRGLETSDETYEAVKGFLEQFQNRIRRSE